MAANTLLTNRLKTDVSLLDALTTIDLSVVNDFFKSLGGSLSDLRLVSKWARTFVDDRVWDVKINISIKRFLFNFEHESNTSLCIRSCQPPDLIYLPACKTLNITEESEEGGGHNENVVLCEAMIALLLNICINTWFRDSKIGSLQFSVSNKRTNNAGALLGLVHILKRQGRNLVTINIKGITGESATDDVDDLKRELNLPSSPNLRHLSLQYNPKLLCILITTRTLERLTHLDVDDILSLSRTRAPCGRMEIIARTYRMFSPDRESFCKMINIIRLVAQEWRIELLDEIHISLYCVGPSDMDLIQTLQVLKSSCKRLIFDRLDLHVDDDWRQVAEKLKNIVGLSPSNLVVFFKDRISTYVPIVDINDFQRVLSGNVDNPLHSLISTEGAFKDATHMLSATLNIFISNSSDSLPLSRTLLIRSNTLDDVKVEVRNSDDCETYLELPIRSQQDDRILLVSCDTIKGAESFKEYLEDNFPRLRPNISSPDAMVQMAPPISYVPIIFEDYVEFKPTMDFEGSSGVLLSILALIRKIAFYHLITATDKDQAVVDVIHYAEKCRNLFKNAVAL
jgi:hypothetical protein